MKKDRMKKTVVLCVLAGLLAFIWTNSMRNKAQSMEQSEGLLRILEPLMTALLGEDANCGHILRKMAHFVEFAALGADLGMIPVAWKKKGLQPRLVSSFEIMACALIDETIQIFSDRGSRVQDVWLDFAGGVVGLAVMTAAVIFWKKWKEKHRRH